MEMNIVIVGAGLGGLGTALALKIAAPSINVLVLEAAAELAEVSRLHNQLGRSHRKRLTETYPSLDRSRPSTYPERDQRATPLGPRR